MRRKLATIVFWIGAATILAGFLYIVWTNSHFSTGGRIIFTGALTALIGVFFYLMESIE